MGTSNPSNAMLLLRDARAGHLEGLRQHQPALPEIAAEICSSLTAYERRIVAHSAATDDFYVLLALPGDNKFNILAEIAAQAVRQGLRVALVGSDAATLDSVLLRFHEQTAGYAVRLLAAAEDVSNLPPGVRCLTVASRLEELKAHRVYHKSQSRQPSEDAAQAQQARIQTWIAWRERVALWQTVHQSLDKLTQEHQNAAQSVALESVQQSTSDAADGRYLQDFHAEKHRHAARLADLEQAVTAAEAKLGECLTDLDKRRTLVQGQESQVALRGKRNWLSLTWWKASFNGRADERLAEFRVREHEAEAACQVAQAQVDELKQQFEIELQRHRQAIDHILSSEIENRRQRLELRIQDLRKQQDEILRKWNDDGAAFGQREIWSDQPTGLVVIEQIRRAEHDALRAGTEPSSVSPPRRIAARKIDSSVLLKYADLVALSPLAFDGKTLVGLESFDLLLCVDADRLDDRTFHSAMLLARRWVWCGAPTPLADASEQEKKPFQQLVSHLLATAEHADCNWIQSDGLLRCVLFPQASSGEVQIENLVDHPDVQLHIHMPKVGPPLLHAITFPEGAYDYVRAKQLLATDLGERPMAKCKAWAAYSIEDGDYVVTCCTSRVREECRIEWEDGIVEFAGCHQREELGTCWHTRQLRFRSASGWTWRKVADWLAAHMQLKDAGRIALLRSKHENPGIARHVSRLLQSLGYGLCNACDHKGGHPEEQIQSVHWIPSKLTEHWVNSQHNPNSPSGHTLDLTDRVQRNRLPTELQAALPHRGSVNLSEARAVLQHVEHLLSQNTTVPKVDSGRGTAQYPRLLITAPQSAQLNLLQLLWTQASGARPHSEAHIEFVPLSRLHTLSAELVIVSLHRAGRSSTLHWADWLNLLQATCGQLYLFGEIDSPGPTSDSSPCGISRFLHDLRDCSARPEWLTVSEGATA